MIEYLNGKYLNDKDCKISPYDRGFLFSDGVYEVIKYTGKKFICFDEHKQRLSAGLNFLGINKEFIESLLDVCIKLLSSNNLSGKQSVIYIQITRGISKPRTHFYEKNISPSVYANAVPLPSRDSEMQKGVSINLEKDFRWSGCNIKTISLLPAVLARQKAFEQNVSEAIWVRNGLIEEGTHTNFFGIKDGIVYTAPLTKFILPGITRRTVIDICKSLAIPVKEKYIRENELKHYDEFFLTSTTLDVTPVLGINSLNIKKKKAGPVTGKIQRCFLEMLNAE
jgi:D-alanine transaminase